MKNKTQVIAMYLPQFHRIKENDEWWGEGFTEWTNVKKAKPLYRGHLQPRIPYENNYYDLSDERIMMEQMQMALEYGVDGFCFYHYWFNGKKLLEKPVEQLLERKDVILPYCFCWANEPWTRTWDGDSGAKQVLMPQDYGMKEEWGRHFDYLSLFFKQEKYIKVEGKPVLLIYKVLDILHQKEMLEEWDRLAKLQGYPGLFVIMVHRMRATEEADNYGDGIVDFEPFATMRMLETLMVEPASKTYRGNQKINRNKYYKVLDYADFCEQLVNKYTAKEKKHFLGLFTGWDNTPRRGSETQLIFENNSPEIFEKYFRIQYQKSLRLNNDFLFINAWNEWGEGTFLEPDEKYQYGYLNAIKKVKDEQIKL